MAVALLGSVFGVCITVIILCVFCYNKILVPCFRLDYFHPNTHTELPPLPRRKLTDLLSREEFEKGKHNQTCCVCMENFSEKEPLCVLDCKHSFHENCVDKWLTEKQSRCPFCKSVIKPASVRSQTSLSSPTGQSSPVVSGTTTLATPNLSPGQAKARAQPGPSFTGGVISWNPNSQ